MSLQVYDFQLAANVGASFDVQAQGRYIYYYAGTTPLNTDGNNALLIRPGTSGNSLLLKPGQCYRMDANESSPTYWRLQNFVGAEVITGKLLIGEGEFLDMNTNNTFKLDATFANNVKVTNADVDGIPVRNKRLTNVPTPTIVTAGVAQVLISNDATLEQLRVRNTNGSATVGIGPIGVTLANATIILSPGDTWIEDNAPGIAWYAISSIAATDLAVQGVK